jgi:hypothetical protein
MFEDSEENLNEKRTLFGFVFETMPSYQKILNGTPKLSLPFEVFSDPDMTKSFHAQNRGRC